MDYSSYLNYSNTCVAAMSINAPKQPRVFKDRFDAFTELKDDEFRDRFRFSKK